MLRAGGAALRLTAGRNPSANPPQRPRVLLVRPDHLGDLLMASPAVELLRKALPGAHVAMMVGPWAAEVARRDPLLDEVILCPFPGFTRAPKGSTLAPYRLLMRTAGELRRGCYDAALLLRFDHWWGAWLAALARIPVRVGYGVPECRPFLTHALDPADRGHWVGQGLEVVARGLEAWGLSDRGEGPSERMGGRWPHLRFGAGEGDAREAARLWGESGLRGEGPVVAFHPGTGAPTKLWPEDRWIGLGWTLAAGGARVVVTGSMAEAAAAERIAAAVPQGVSLAGRTELGTLAALFRRCDLVVGVDNGPLHLAVAMGVATVHLFGPTDPALYGPWGDAGRHRTVVAGWPGAPCGRLDLQPPDGEACPCMGAIGLEQVAAECAQLLAAGGRAR